MKPLSKKLKELERARDAEEFSSSARSAYTVCIELLQTWLREADEFAELEQAMTNATSGKFSSWGTVNEVWKNAWMIMRRELFGTTRSEGKK